MLADLKRRVKDAACDMLRIPYDKDGLPYALRRHLQSERPIVMIDIGAHDGEFTAALERYCAVSRGLLVDPLPGKAAKLRARFPAPVYSVFECALSSQSGVADLEVNDFDATSSLLTMHRGMPELATVSYGTRKSVRCQTRTLDDVVAEAGLDRVDLLKIDVQGAEHLVIGGAAGTLGKTSMVWTEVSFRPLYEGSSTFPDVYDLMTAAGFKLFELASGFRSPKGELLQADALFISSVPDA